MSLRIALALVAVLLASGTASAQYPFFGSGYDDFPGRHSSTAEEGALRGMGALVQSAGAANLMNSMAAINVEEARSRNLDNRLKYTETYFQNRELNRAAREAEASPRPTAQELFRLAADAAPSRLTATQLDPLSGAINWPLLLRGNEYAAMRAKIEEIYSFRANYGLTTEQHLQADQLVRALMEQLRAGVAVYPPQDYVESRSFIESLRFELRRA